MVDSADVISLHIKLLDKQLHIHNVYNLVNKKEVSMSILVLKQRLAKNLHKEHIALGDFNLNYESCEGSDVSKPHVEE